MPELRLDLDVMERNATRIGKEVLGLGKQWRPHVKAHSQPKIAKTLVQYGACGVTAATVAEVEVMATAGIPSVLLAHIAVAEAQLNRLAACTAPLSCQGCSHLCESKVAGETRVADVCDRADIAQKTFFNHFPTKLDLLREIAHAGVEQLMFDIEDIRKADLGTPERIHRFFDTVAALLLVIQMLVPSKATPYGKLPVA